LTDIYGIMKDSKVKMALGSFFVLG